MADFGGENAVKRSRIYVRKENKEKISDCNEETGEERKVLMPNEVAVEIDQHTAWGERQDSQPVNEPEKKEHQPTRDRQEHQDSRVNYEHQKRDQHTTKEVHQDSKLVNTLEKSDQHTTGEKRQNFHPVNEPEKSYQHTIKEVPENNEPKKSDQHTIREVPDSKSVNRLEKSDQHSASEVRQDSQPVNEPEESDQHMIREVPKDNEPEKSDQHTIREVPEHSKPVNRLEKSDQHSASEVRQDSQPVNEPEESDEHMIREVPEDTKPINELEKKDQYMIRRVPQARDTVKECLHSVMVCKWDAADLEQKLEEEIFDKWQESCEVMKTTKIPMRKLDGFLDHLKGAYEGIDDTIREKMNTIKNENQDIVEWSFNNDNNSGVRYGMVAFGRSPDQKYVDCMYALYKIDFTIAPKGKHPTVRGLLSYTTTTVKKKNHTNFFRLKALEEFNREGLFEEINYVGTLDDIPDLFEC